jgi:hypothetical protein
LPRTQRAGAPLLKILVVDDPVLIREASRSVLNGIAPVNLHASRADPRPASNIVSKPIDVHATR